MADTKYGEVWTSNHKEFLPGEPVFIIRGKDFLAATAVRAYANLAFEHDLPTDFLESVESVAQRIEDWQEKNPDKVKVPD